MIQQYIQILHNNEKISDDTIELYGRLERCVIKNGVRERPMLLTYRPHKNPSIGEVPTSFVLGKEALISLSNSYTLTDILVNVISLDPVTIKERLDLVQSKQLDHLLILFTKELVPVETGDVEGILKLLQIHHIESFYRFQLVSRIFQDMAGPNNFNKRLDFFTQDQWGDLKRIKNCMWLPSEIHQKHPECGCEHYSFEYYCRKFDIASDDERILETRRMLYIMLGCNEFYGFDGYTWDKDGNRLGKEYLAINQKIEDPIFSIFLSDIARFQI